MNKDTSSEAKNFFMTNYRLMVLRIGIIAVIFANGIFATSRFLQQGWTHSPTPWWCNLAGFVLMLLLYYWYREAPLKRVVIAIHATAAVATMTLLIPLAYGMASSVWWLSLIGIAMMLMANRVAALFWCLVSVLLMVTAPWLVDYWHLGTQHSESAFEVVLARAVFAIMLFGIALAFRQAVRAQARELRRVAAELEVSNAAKDRFLRHMGHEFRTPLHGVVSLSDQALHYELSKEQHARILGVHASGMVLSRLLNDVLDFTASPGNLTPLTKQPFSPRDILVEMSAALSPQASETGLRLNVNVSEILLEPRIGDPEAFRIIVHKLVNNALHFTREGEVSVSLASWRNKPEGLVLTVTDTGIGMSEDMQASLFSQDETKPSRISGGLGLGLAMIRELVERIGGRIECHSVINEGARFVVYLAMPPGQNAKILDHAADLSLQHRAPVEVKEDVTKPLRILVCEDDPICQTLLVEGLKSLGHEPEPLDDGQAGFERYCKENFDLVITDLEMPRLDGNALLKWIRAEDARLLLPPVAMVVVTASTRSVDGNRLLANGFDAWLSKPFLISDVSRILEQLAAKIEQRTG
jgi:signal transduction histidine kinase/ActR/RegA family two-component response regulator